MEPVTALKAGTEAISLLAALAKLVKEAKATPGATDSSLLQVLGRLQIEAVRLSRDLENRIRALVENVHDYGLNPAWSLEQHLANLNWYNFLSRSRVKAFREECLSAYRQLTGFIDDATAILVCEQRTALATTSFGAALEVKRLLDGLFTRPNVPLGAILDGLLATATRVSSDLQSA